MKSLKSVWVAMLSGSRGLVKLGQPGQACKAYAELEDVYGSSLRAPLKAALPGAKSEARCS